MSTPSVSNLSNSLNEFHCFENFTHFDYHELEVENVFTKFTFRKRVATSKRVLFKDQPFNDPVFSYL